MTSISDRFHRLASLTTRILWTETGDKVACRTCPIRTGNHVGTLVKQHTLVPSPTPPLNSIQWDMKEGETVLITHTSLCYRSIKCRQWKHNLDYYVVVFAHLATRCGINAKYPSGLDLDRWIPRNIQKREPSMMNASFRIKCQHRILESSRK